jgi:hypothetical protein
MALQQDTDNSTDANKRFEGRNVRGMDEEVDASAGLTVFSFGDPRPSRFRAVCQLPPMLAPAVLLQILLGAVVALADGTGERGHQGSRVHSRPGLRSNLSLNGSMRHAQRPDPMPSWSWG